MQKKITKKFETFQTKSASKIDINKARNKTAKTTKPKNLKSRKVKSRKAERIE